MSLGGQTSQMPRRPDPRSRAPLPHCPSSFRLLSQRGFLGPEVGRAEPSWSDSDPVWLKDTEQEKTTCWPGLGQRTSTHLLTHQHCREVFLTPPTKNIFPTLTVKVLSGHSRISCHSSQPLLPLSPTLCSKTDTPPGLVTCWALCRSLYRYYLISSSLP